MTSNPGKCWAAVAFCLMCAAASIAQTQSRSDSRVEVETFFGAMIAGKEIGRRANATGGEQLIARLNHGGAFGLRAGVHSDLLGLEAGFLTSSNRAEVKNEFGVAFPNHAERPLICSGDALIYPFRRRLAEGMVRPYFTSGFGGMVLSADLDNISDKESHGSLIWNAGGGVKVFVGEDSALYVDLRFTNHRLLNSRATRPTDLRSVSIGVGARF